MGAAAEKENNMEKRARSKTLQMAQLAILLAILLIMAFTPLGYLKIGPLSVSFLTLPVAIGAVILGPKAAIILGAAFGLTSFYQCLGMDALGVALMGVSPVRTFIMCFVPRVLIGVITGYLYQLLKYKNDKVSTAVTCLAAPIVNTVFFLGTMVLFFGQTPVLQQFGTTVWAILSVMGIANVIPETLVCLLAGTAICLALKKALKL